MSKLFAFAALFVLLGSGSTIAIAAESEVKVACKDGTMNPAGKDACSKHGGLWKATSSSSSTPIDTTKGLSPPSQIATTNKTRTSTTAASNTTRKKASSSRTRDPTAKCMDGALYYTRERRGACAKHGGVDKWYGW